MERKFHHKVIDIAIKVGLLGTKVYGILGGIYFAVTRGITDFGVYV